MARELRFDLNVAANALLCPNPNEFYSRAYLDKNIEGNFRLLPDVKYKTKIANNEFDRVLRASTCSWDSANVANSNLDAMDIDVDDVSIMAQICQFDAEKAFFSNMIQSGSNHSNFTPQMFMTEYWKSLAAKAAEETALIMWQGDKALDPAVTFLAETDGFNKKLLASATAGTADDVVGITGVAITKANIIAEMSKVYQSLKKTILHKTDDLRWYMAPNVAAAYLEAVAENNTILYTTMNPELTWLGRIKIVIQDGMADNEMVLTRYQNLIYAFDALRDGEELKAIDLRGSVAEPTLRTRADLKMGFFLAEKTKNEIVYYSPSVPV